MGKGGKRRKLRSNQLRNTDRASKSSEHDCDIVESIFPGLYLTLIALIQGIALAKLVDKINEPSVVLNQVVWLQITVTGMTIFTIWHHYMYGV